MLIIKPDEAATLLRQGKILDVTLDIAEEALALTIPFVFRHINPTAVDGKTALARFRKLADNAGLPGDHSAYGVWFTLRALRANGGDNVSINYNCPIARALADTLGCVPTSTNGFAIRSDRTVDSAISLTTERIDAAETAAIATPGGIIRIPSANIVSTAGTWASALTAVDKVAPLLGRAAYDSDPNAIVELEWTSPDASGAVDADSIHEDWSPEIVFHETLKPHPAKLIQSATLATVTPPAITYRPRLPRRVLESGFISNAQFEFVAAAGEAHGRFLPIDPEKPSVAPSRAGIFLADGTGAGKTNEILGVILDNIVRGRKQAIIILAKRRHRFGFIQAWKHMGRDTRDFIMHWDVKNGDKIPNKAGILLTTYGNLRDYDADKHTYPRVQQIVDWAGTDFQGVMAFDEAQEMRNAAGGEDVSGKSETSRQGLAGVELQDALPQARIIYASATGATDVHNLAYSVRLGLWGEGTCFTNRYDFIKRFEEGGIADLEQVTLSLKASGVYMARSLSFEGVETRHLPVALTPQERATYNQAATMWSHLWDAFQHCAKLCDVPLGDKDLIKEMRKNGLRGAIPYSHLNGMFEANRKVAMATLIAAFKARGVIADAREQIEAGNAVVVQMQNTYEAQLNRALARMESADDIRLEPAELVSFAEQIPTERQIIVKKSEVNSQGDVVEVRTYQPMLDASGNPIEHSEAVRIRNTLIADCRSLKLPLPPLDQIMLAFGPGRVAEVTGRTKRLIPDRPNGTLEGASKMKIEERSEIDRMQDIEAFHDAKKPMLIFSTGAGGSSLSYHAKIGTKNTARRVHYLIQLGYRADEVTQGIGRTHRSDQVCAPLVTLVSCDLPADRLYASRIVSALFKLGALTQGHRHATSNGMFDERDCMDGPYAVGAWEDLRLDIQEGLIPNYTWEQFMADMGLGVAGTEENERWNKTVHSYVLTNINRMINRVAALTDRRQVLIFDHLRERIDARIERAIADGSFNAGPETLKAKSLSIVTERSLNLDRVHGAPTRLLRIRKKSELATNSFGEAYKRYLSSRGGFGDTANFRKHRTTGAVALIATGKPIFTALGDKMSTREIITPTSTTTRLTRIVEREPWIPFADMDLVEAMWNAAVEGAPTESVSFVTIVAGALLPVWNALHTTTGYRNAVYRLQTDDGRQIVGRPLAAYAYPEFCETIEQSAAPDAAEVAEIIEHLKAGSKVILAAGAKHMHTLTGDFTGSKMTGVTIEFGITAGTALSVLLDALPSAGNSRGMSSQCPIATRPQHIEDALSAVMTLCPPVYIDEDKPVVAPAPAVVAIAPAPAANANTATAAFQQVAKAA